MTTTTLSFPLRDLRKTHKLNQIDLAKLCNTSRERVSVWENNVHVPKLETQVKLAKVFNMPLAELQSLCDWPKTPDVFIRGLEGGKA